MTANVLKSFVHNGGYILEPRDTDLAKIFRNRLVGYAKADHAFFCTIFLGHMLSKRTAVGFFLVFDSTPVDVRL